MSTAAEARQIANWDVHEMQQTLFARLVWALEEAQAERNAFRKLQGQANYLLARVVSAANISAINGEDGFVQRYDMPVGPIHKAIPFLAGQGICVTYDGRILNSPELIDAEAETTT